MSEDLLKTIGRLRRAMPRNADVMAICDELAKHLAIKAIEPIDDYVKVRCGHNERVEINFEAKTLTKFDKRAYQRDYMRKRRAKPKD